MNSIQFSVAIVSMTFIFPIEGEYAEETPPLSARNRLSSTTTTVDEQIEIIDEQLSLLDSQYKGCEYNIMVLSLCSIIIEFI